MPDNILQTAGTWINVDPASTMYILTKLYIVDWEQWINVDPASTMCSNCCYIVNQNSYKGNVWNRGRTGELKKK